MTTQAPFVTNVTVSNAAWGTDVDTATYWGLTGVAGTNTITATGPASMTAYAAHQRFEFIPAATNTGATTLNITQSGGSALGARNVFSGGAACVGGEIVISVPCVVVYDGTQFNIVGPYNSGLIPGGQIKFPATDNPSSNVNTLDDYEEGTWTPALNFDGATTGITYATQSGTYTKIGRLVVLHFYIALSNKGSATGVATLRGLPFNQGSAAAMINGQIIEHTSMATSFVSAILRGGQSSAILNFYIMTAAAASYSTAANTDFQNSSSIGGTFTYHV